MICEASLSCISMQFSVSKDDGTGLYTDSKLWIPKSSIFNPRATFAQTSGCEAWLLSPVEAVCKYDNVYARKHPRSRGSATKRILYTGPSCTFNSISFTDRLSLSDIRLRYNTVQHEDIEDLITLLTMSAPAAILPASANHAPANTTHVDAGAAALSYFIAASSAVSQSAGHMTAIFTGFLDDSYYEERLTATTMAEAATTSAAFACAALHASPSALTSRVAAAATDVADSRAVLVQQAVANIAASKKVIATRLVTCFPSTIAIIAAAHAASISSVETQHVVIGSCFTQVEDGLNSNVLSRGAVGPECPVCLEDFDITSEDMPHSPVILGCVYPLDYTSGAMHPICNGCWTNILHMASMTGVTAACPICRALTTGRSVSQCAYNIMIDLAVVRTT